MNTKENLRVVLKYNLIFFLTIFCYLGKLHSQDLHYSQFYHSPVNVSPALTGIFNGDQRFSVSIRDQWRSVPVPWFTTSLSYDQRVMPKSNKYFFGVGGLLNYDRQGDSNINLLNINVSGSFNYILNKNNILSLGLLLGYSTRGFNINTLSFDKQWNGVSFDPGADPGESLNIDRFSFIETAVGLNYRFQKTSRTKIDIGFGGFHLTQTSYTFLTQGSENLPIRFTGHLIGTVRLSQKLNLQIDGLYQRQDVYTEYVFGALLDLYLNEKRGNKTNLMLGVGYRTTEAFFPKLGFHYNQFLFAFSYDIDLSEFNAFTSNRGGPELHFSYLITHVKPFTNKKICPIF